MKPTAWRPVLQTLYAIAALASIATIFSVVGMGGTPPWSGRWGAYFSDSPQPFNFKVSVVDPGGPADQAGLRRGDLIDIRANTLLERFSITQRALNGKSITLLVRRGPLKKEITVVPQAVPTFYWGQFLLDPLVALWLLLFAALIAWRRFDVPELRLLSLTLFFYALNFVTGDYEWAAPWAWVHVVALVCATVSSPLVVALWAAVAGCFAPPLAKTRLAAQWLCYAFVAIAFAIGFATAIGIMTLRFDPVGLFYSPIWQIPSYLLVAAGLVCSLLAIAASHGVERQRAVWILVPLAILNCVGLGASIISQLQLSYAGVNIVGDINRLLNFVVPIALTYAAFSRRLIDVGFALNRAVIFTIVTAVVIGSFILIEWAASMWLTGTTHISSAVVGMGVALALGLSMRYIHGYVDQFVDRIFFRKRHEDEAALRRFARESSYITDRSVLLERAVRTIEKHTNSAEATILIPDGAGAYSSAQNNGNRIIVGENDPGIVALRAWHKPVDLHVLDDSELRGEFAFPMVSRGTLVGVLTCDTKRDGEAYAPDESDALLALADGVGSALGVLTTERDRPIELILREIVALREALERTLSRSAAQLGE